MPMFHYHFKNINEQYDNELIQNVTWKYIIDQGILIHSLLIDRNDHC